MADKDKDLAVATAVEPDAQDHMTDTSNNKDGDDKELLDSKLQDPEVVAELDRRVTSAMKKAEAKATERETAAREKAEKKAREAKLLEDGQLQEAFDESKVEQQRAEAKVKEYEKRDEVNKLLDHKEVTDPELRSMLMDQNCDLETLDARVDALNVMIDRLVEQRVGEKLHTKPPPKTTVDETPTGLQDQLKAAESEAKKTGDWTAFRVIANQIQDKIALGRTG